MYANELTLFSFFVWSVGQPASRARQTNQTTQSLLIPAVVSMRLHQGVGAAGGGAQSPDAGASRKRDTCRHVFMGAVCVVLLLLSSRIGILGLPCGLVYAVFTMALFVHLNDAPESRLDERDSEKFDAGLSGRVAGLGGAELVMSVAPMLAVITGALAASVVMLDLITLRGIFGSVLVSGLAKAAWWVSASRFVSFSSSDCERDRQNRKTDDSTARRAPRPGKPCSASRRWRYRGTTAGQQRPSPAASF